MDYTNVIEKTKVMVRDRLSDDSSGHDWWHTYRVWKQACYLAKRERADTVVVSLSALLHDVADYKLNNGDESAGRLITERWLNSFDVSPDIIRQVAEIVEKARFTGAASSRPDMSLEMKVVLDADFLEALGAIGIARVFMYAGNQNQRMFVPDEIPTYHKGFSDYKSRNSSAFTHFHEKIIHLYDWLQTDSAKQLAKERFEFTKQFLSQFEKEIEFSDSIKTEDGAV